MKSSISKFEMIRSMDDEWVDDLIKYGEMNLQKNLNNQL